MRKVNYLLLALISTFAISSGVKALTDVECITSEGTHTCVLSDDIEVSDTLAVQGDIELDLNGHTIKAADGVLIKGGIVGVKRGANLTIKDTVGTGKITAMNTESYGAVQVTLPGEVNEGEVATLTVEGGTLEGYYYAIVGNGNRHNTSITVNGGNLIPLSATGTGIYHPQEGTLTINGGIIKSGTGIEMRSGSLKVTGGVIIGNSTPTSVTPNGNGTTTDGAGIAIAQHTTLKDIDVEITGGTVKGYSAVYESNPQNNANVAEQVKVSIKDGNFEAINGGVAVIYSEDLTNFVEGGTFNKELPSEYVTSSYGIDTTYGASAYVAPVETYDVELDWDDLHWVFVYEGNVTNPAESKWVKYETYNAELENATDENALNYSILYGDDETWNNAALEIQVENKSSFAVDVTSQVVEQSGVENYTTAAGLQVGEGVNPTYAASATKTNLETNATTSFSVKPTSTRFVNDNGATANVTGEINVSFAKTA